MLPVTPPAAPLGYVPGELVHKHRQSEVLLTGWRESAPDRFTVTARWPGDHPFYGVRHGVHDSLLLSETIRQIFPLLSHCAYSVPLGHHLLWDTYDFSLHGEALRTDSSPSDLDLHVTCLNSVRRGDRVTALTLRIDVERGELPLATAHTRFTIQNPTVYRRLRGKHGELRSDPVLPLPSPAPPSHVGRTACGDVALSAPLRDGFWQLRMNNRHPFLFDHPLDHAPGMLLMEAARQAAQSMYGPQPVTVVAMQNRFLRYVEFDTPCWVEAGPRSDDARGRPQVDVVLRQEGSECYATTVTLEPIPQASPATPPCPHHPHTAVPDGR
jgi:hypothetical protein